MVSPVGTFFIVLFVLLIVAAVGWIVFTQLRARRLGLPAPPFSSYLPFTRSEPSSSYGPPQPAPGGIRGWFGDKMRALRGSGGGGGSRSAAGTGYERPSRRGFGPLDPDEAWDARVGQEADGYYGYSGYEEQELGLRPHAQGGAPQQQQHFQQQQVHRQQPPADTAYAGAAGYSNVALGADEQRGRTLSRSPGVGLGVDGAGGRNPFDDDAAEPSNMSLRGVSPRPIDTSVANAKKGGVAHHHDSPTSERRSIFREDV
ncbi:hypothetical protein F4804DRAFT_326171 [Jackrogersella minutella]|nr:hypothetical protein F4804DRAFT_326171 [Jackrogersella minutella]